MRDFKDFRDYNKAIQAAKTDVIEVIASPPLGEIGTKILISNMTDAIIYNQCIYSSWAVYYGICHALVMTAKTTEDASYWKELRSYFMAKNHRYSGVIYQD